MTTPLYVWGQQVESPPKGPRAEVVCFMSMDGTVSVGVGKWLGPPPLRRTRAGFRWAVDLPVTSSCHVKVGDDGAWKRVSSRTTLRHPGIPRRSR